MLGGGGGEVECFGGCEVGFEFGVFGFVGIEGVGLGVEGGFFLFVVCESGVEFFFEEGGFDVVFVNFGVLYLGVLGEIEVIDYVVLVEFEVM